jgi:uncharacterized protein (TIGR00297 family)
MVRRPTAALEWQSKTILILVVPWTVASVILQANWWWHQVPVVAYQTLGISAIFGLIVWKMKAATIGGAATGAAITASLMFSTAQYPYEWSWLHGGLMPLMAVFLLTYAATRIGRAKKEKLGTAEAKRGRNAAQVAANLGAAALVAQPTLWRIIGLNPFPFLLSFVAFSALAEAAADTVSSEIGQVLGGRPRMITNFRRVEPGTDGGITLAGTSAGIAAAAAVGITGFGFLGASPNETASSGLGLAVAGTFGLLFDSLLGATLERRGLLNNDAVNFLSTLSSAVVGFPVGVLILRFLLKI